MSSITFLQLRDAVRERADLVGDTSFLPDAELGRMVNAEGAELHDLVVSRFAEDFTVSWETTIASGNTIALVDAPAGQPFYKLRGLDFNDTANGYRDVKKFDWVDRNQRNVGNWYYGGRDVRYRLVGQTIYITPDDNATGQYRVWYVYGYVDLADDGDVITYPENWHEYIIAGAAARALIKEDSDPSAHLRIKAGLRERIMAASATRDAGRRGVIQRVRNRRRGWGGDYDE